LWTIFSGIILSLLNPIWILIFILGIYFIFHYLF
jgi:hypothetical protein